MPDLFDWIQSHPQLTSIALGVSILLLLGSILLSPFLAALIPQDYFSNSERPTLHPGNPLIQVLRGLIKNLLGLLLLIMGLVMLVTPGQGLITIFVALMALDYPGKYRLERWLIAKPAIYKSINWLRQRVGAAPLILDSR